MANEKVQDKPKLKTYPHGGVCLGAETCGRCKELRAIEAHDELVKKNVASLITQKIAAAEYTGTQFKFELSDGRTVVFSSMTPTIMQVYEPKPKG